MDEFIATINRIEKLNADEALALVDFAAIGKTRSLKKGEHLVNFGEVVDLMVHVDKGMLRQYITDGEGNEKIVQIHTEGSFYEDCANYGFNRPIEYAIQAIEHCKITCFAIDDILAVSNKHKIFQKIGTTIASLNMNRYREHTSILMKYSPMERYKYMLEHKPVLVQRLSVTHLAQYLDISRETLSRIRARAFEHAIL